jgi:hypothetical protein
MKFRPFCSDQFKKVCTKIEPSADITGTVALCTIIYTRESPPSGGLRSPFGSGRDKNQ